MDEGHAKTPDPLWAHPVKTDFDWPTLYARLGESSDPQTEAIALATETISAVLYWIASTGSRVQGSRRAREMISRRVLVASWNIDPTMKLGTEVLNLSEVARMFGLNPFQLHKLSGDFSRQFGLLHGHHGQAWNRKPR